MSYEPIGGNTTNISQNCMWERSNQMTNTINANNNNTNHIFSGTNGAQGAGNKSINFATNNDNLQNINLELKNYNDPNNLTFNNCNKSNNKSNKLISISRISHGSIIGAVKMDL